MNAGLLHTIARRDRAAEAAARCGVLARQAGLRTCQRALNKRIALLDRTFPHPSMQWSASDPLL